MESTQKQESKLKLYNTLKRQKEEIITLKPGQLSMYNCGPTVYWRAHIGNIRAYVGWDVLHRYLKYTGVSVKRIVNFTDVGHMSSDEDFGEDKIEKTARQENKDPYDIANYYIGTILSDFNKMNILGPDGKQIPQMTQAEIKATTKEQWAKMGWARATDHIQEMIDIVRKIEANGYTYQTDQAVYFDVTKFDRYTELSRQSLSDKLEGVRDEVNVDPQKKHPADFVLWMKSTGNYANHLMHWNSPWGDGFPGWHIECTAMGTKYLGDRFDLHTGGVDHIPVHHTNEIAQNYGAFEKDVVTYWVHNDMLTSKEGDKLSKSKKNAYQFDEILELGYDPMDLRYYFLTVNYRMPLAFSLEGLDGARNARKNLVAKIANISADSAGKSGVLVKSFDEKFREALDDNLNTSNALAVMSELLKSKEKSEDIIATVTMFDEVLGLKLIEAMVKQVKSAQVEIPDDVQKLVDERLQARVDKNYAKSDELRDKLKELGYEIKDTKVDGKDVQTIVRL